jgi:hypothetical protein
VNKRAARTPDEVQGSSDWTDSRNDIGPLCQKKWLLGCRKASVCRDNVLQTAGEVRSAKVKSET